MIMYPPRSAAGSLESDDVDVAPSPIFIFRCGELDPCGIPRPSSLVCLKKRASRRRGNNNNNNDNDDNNDNNDTNNTNNTTTTNNTNSINATTTTTTNTTATVNYNRTTHVFTRLHETTSEPAA